MAKVIPFPRKFEPNDYALETKTCKRFKVTGKSLLQLGIWMMWIPVVVVWPFVKWFFALDVLFQFFRMMHFWDKSGTYAGWMFVAHFAIFCAITYFVRFYQPQAVRKF